MDIKKALEVLEADETMELDAIRRSYRDLVEIWHPDRYAHNQRLSQRANDKLKEINNAYEIIKKYFKNIETDQEENYSEQESFTYVKCVNCGVTNRLSEDRSKDFNTKCGKCGKNIYIKAEENHSDSTKNQETHESEYDTPIEEKKFNIKQSVIILTIVLIGYLLAEYMVDNTHQTKQMINSILALFY